MKRRKRLLALLLAVLTITSMLMLPAAAENPKIKKVKATVEIPLVGDKIKSLTVTSAEPKKYTATAKVYYWKINTEGKSEAYYPKKNEKFLDNVTYYCRVSFSAASDWKLDYSNLSCEIAGFKSVSKVGTSTWEVSFKPLYEASDSSDSTNTSAKTKTCPYCGKVHVGFLQAIVGLFHKILFKLFGAKK